MEFGDLVLYHNDSEVHEKIMVKILHSLKGTTSRRSAYYCNCTHGSKVGDTVGDKVLFTKHRKKVNRTLDGHNQQQKKEGTRTHGATVGLIVGSKVGDMVGDNVLLAEKCEKSNYAQSYVR